MIAEISIEGWAAVAAIVLSVFGGIGGWVASKLASSQSMVQLTFETLRARIERLEIENDQLEIKLERIMSDFAELKLRERDLLFKLEHLESAHMDLPVPMWVKDTNGVMISCNAAYEKVFLRPKGKTAGEYIGKTDAEMWPREVAEEFGKRDAQVRLSRQVFNGVEMVEDADGKLNPWHIIKFPRYASGGLLVGIGGLAFSKEIIYECESCNS